jgi:GMP synthase (glutamine-hydrolysing)
VRELNVETVLLPISTPAVELSGKYAAVIISGGPQSVYDVAAPNVDATIFDIGVPVLGICYGMQLMCFQNGRQVGKKTSREDGQFQIQIDNTSALYADMESEQSVLLTHGDTVFDAPEGWKVTAKSGSLIASIENTAKRLFGVQFHPEVDLTLEGTKIFKNFLFGICGLKGSFTLKDRKQIAIEHIQERVGPDAKVLVLVSGGVDSSVCAALCTLALGPERVFAVHISNGFMRKDESKRVKEALARLNLNLKMIDASEEFYSGTTSISRKLPGHGASVSYITDRLDCTINPEEKRKIIGDTFMRVAQAEIARLGLKAESTYLAQGTLRPDLIESASHTVSAAAEVIKTHHNDTDLVRELRQKGHVIEPLSEYHKDEVRALGRDLGLPDELVARHPFPGPGLAIRIICCDHKPDIDEEFHSTNARLQYLLTKFNPDDATVPMPEELAELREDEREVLRKLLKTTHVSAVLLPLKTVGVQGDGRSYKFICALSSDNLASPDDPEAIFHPDWAEMFGLAKFLPKIYHNINRVVYVFGKRIRDPVTQITPTKLTKDVIAQLQDADDKVNEILLHQDQLKCFSQAPVILFPVGFEKGDTHRSIAIRTLITNDFMTGAPAIPGVSFDRDALLSCVKSCLTVPGIARVVYDLTSKPPATTEWE